MEQENSRHYLANFTHELTPEYIKANVEKVVSCSSGPGLLCEIFDCDHNKITADELVQSYYHTSIKDPENDLVSEEQEKEQEFSSVGQTEPYPVHSDQQTEKKEQGISNIDLEDYSCYYCKYRTNNEEEYKQHVVSRHPGRLAYPNKAEIEKSGLKAQGKDWER
jgi:hypothetical protein